MRDKECLKEKLRNWPAAEGILKGVASKSLQRTFMNRLAIFRKPVVHC